MIAAKKIAGALGAEVEGVDLSKPLSRADYAEVRRLWLEHLVIFFRDQTMTEAQYMAFAEQFGEPIEYPLVKGIAGYPKIIEVKKLEHEGYRCDLVVHLRPTGPVRRVELIDKAIETILARPDADSLRSVSPPTETPYKMWRIADGLLEPILNVPGVVEPYCQPRQSLPEVFWQNGYVDIVRPRVVLNEGMMCGRTILPFVIDEPIFEIDYVENIPAVEAALARLDEGSMPVAAPAIRRHPV